MDKIICETCFKEIQSKTDLFLLSQEDKHDKFLAKMETKHNNLTIVNMSILGMFGLAIAVIFAMVLTKANAKESLTAKQFELLEQTMTRYYDQRFTHVDGSKIDESTYKWHIETILSGNWRGEKPVKFYKDDYEKAINNN